MYLQDPEDRSADDERLASKLAYQSRRIERVLAQHRVSGQVVGGTVQRNSTSFQIRDYLMDGIGRLRDLAQDLPRLLGVHDVALNHERGLLQLSLSDTERLSIPLLDLLSFASIDASVTTVMGVDQDGCLVCLDTSGQDIPNVLLSGKRGSGKASLLRTMVVSLAMLNRQSSVQIAVISGRAKGAVSAYSMLEPLSYLPHMLAPVAYDLADGADILRFLAGEFDHRKENRVRIPSMVIIVDGIVELLEQGGQPIHEPVAQLVQHGHEAGIFLILSTERPDSDVLGEQMRSNLAVRIVGKLDDERATNIAAGRSRLQSLPLFGFGDFAAIVNGNTITSFRSAVVADHDLHYCIDLLQRSARVTLLARPYDQSETTNRANVKQLRNDAENGARSFRYDGENVVLRVARNSPVMTSTADEPAWPEGDTSTEELEP